ncbi:hypothetical protein EII38_02900 [Streptococcus minor]|uniref:Uncharacterized protein n=1 Tax=Streptococcus minor TaxID=229549 RepID=A0A3P1VES2_9STRE|nr:hypothetical protein [Streptococcus minor]MDO5079439.1 hypothetical protein [Streptococcus minor]RRD32701.1 hypothetical protein EII38_02900 [Streptococcus minor]
MSVQQTKRKVHWGQLFFGVLWLVGAILIFALYQTGGLSSSIPVPRVVWLVYEFLGIEMGTLVQALLSILIIVTSFPKEK